MKYTLLLLFLSSGLASASAHDQLGVVNSAAQTTCKTGLSGAACYDLSVSCPDVEMQTVHLKIFMAAHSVGLVMLGTGGLGNGLFESDTYGYVTIDKLLSADYTVVEIAFTDGWQVNTNGYGLRKGACRYSTVANWVKHRFSPTQPFCASGSSAGSAVIGYGLSHYGLDQTLNFALLTSGPPFSRVDWACDDSQPPTLEYCTNLMVGMDVGIANAQHFIDPAYRPTYTAACSTMEQEHSTALDHIFLPDSIDSPDADLNYGIPVDFMYGALDTHGTAPNQGEYYRRSISSPTSRSCVHDAPHTIADVLDGAEAIANDLIQRCH